MVSWCLTATNEIKNNRKYKNTKSAILQMIDISQMLSIIISGIETTNKSKKTNATLLMNWNIPTLYLLQA